MSGFGNPSQSPPCRLQPRADSIFVPPKALTALMPLSGSKLYRVEDTT